MTHSSFSNNTSEDQSQQPFSPFKFNTKFMQNYQVSAPVVSGTKIITSKNRNGDLELFSIGGDGNIYNIFEDSTSDTGWNQIQLPSQIPSSQYGNSIAVCQSLEGNLVLIRNDHFANLDNISGWLEQFNSDSRWSLDAQPYEILNPWIQPWQIREIACKNYK